MTKTKVRELLTNATFTFAKSMPKFKHFYTLRKNWNDKEFVDVVKHIRKFGKKEKFFKREFTYYYFGDYKYWTMGDTLPNTILINRAEI